MSGLRKIRVFAYRNLNRGGFSARAHPGGRVVAHADTLLIEDAAFRVSEAGRRRVLDQRRRNVHAGVVGDLVVDPRLACELLKRRRFPADYNPYRGPAFVTEDGRPVESSPSVLLEGGRAWCEEAVKEDCACSTSRTSRRWSSRGSG